MPRDPVAVDRRRSDFQGRYHELSGAPLEPKPVQTPYPELMDGEGGHATTTNLAMKSV